jgi:hypothetical protein
MTEGPIADIEDCEYKGEKGFKFKVKATGKCYWTRLGNPVQAFVDENENLFLSSDEPIICLDQPITLNDLMRNSWILRR